MKARGINFNEHQVKRVLGGNMTQIRQMVKLLKGNHADKAGCVRYDEQEGWIQYGAAGAWVPFPQCPFGKIGDELYVRETWKSGGVYLDNGTVHIEYKAGGRIFENREDCGKYILLDGEDKWHPSTRMLQWMSRIQLRVKDIRVERVRDISRDDAIAEGIDFDIVDISPPIHSMAKWIAPGVTMTDMHGEKNVDVACHNSPQDAFQCLWDSIISRRGFGPDDNPLLWVLEFERIDA